MARKKRQRQQERPLIGEAADAVRTRRRKYIYGGAFVGAVLLLGVVIAVLGVLAEPGEKLLDNASPASVPSSSLSVPDFTVKTTSWSGGENFTLSQNLGKPTALFFIAAWCFTCIPETQAWAKIHEEYGDRLNILVLDVDTSETEQDLLRFKEKAGGGNHLWAMDVDNRVARAYSVPTLDTTIIIGPDGREVYRDFVPTTYNKLKSVIAPLLESSNAVNDQGLLLWQCCYGLCQGISESSNVVNDQGPSPAR